MSEKREYIILNLERNMWWKENRRGYVDYFHEAGRFTYSEAKAICDNANIIETEDIMLKVER